uniref:Uncharacterized protein n=1 Tax=Petromyzon marinus TaxID=7757 RepID=S4RBF9_PETMA
APRARSFSRNCVRIEFLTNRCGYLMHKLCYVLLGITLLLLGAYSEVERRRYRTLDGSFLSPSIILITAGCISFPVSFLGFVGALRDNLTLLR